MRRYVYLPINVEYRFSKADAIFSPPRYLKQQCVCSTYHKRWKIESERLKDSRVSYIRSEYLYKV